jgi:hypothetical protein
MRGTVVWGVTPCRQIEVETFWRFSSIDTVVRTSCHTARLLYATAADSKGEVLPYYIASSHPVKSSSLV